MEVQYYVVRSVNSGDPILLHRFFSGSERVPESAGYGRPTWQPNAALWAALSMGELDNNDQISEDDANLLLSKWSSKITPLI